MSKSDKITLVCEECHSAVRVKPLGDWTTRCKRCGGMRKVNHQWQEPEATKTDKL